MMSIDTEALSGRYRRVAIDLSNRKLLITNFSETEQEGDLSEPPNCRGFGRIRHFRVGDGQRWPKNPLPTQPAQRALQLSPSLELRAQVFQNAICNWRCWYCFVPFALLNANPRHSEWLGPDELLDRYVSEPDPPAVIDLSGGQPDLTPEWVPWMMDELYRRKLQDKVYLWSDDNLSNDYFWRYLSTKQQRLMRDFRNYGRVACFKGIDERSFVFNTGAEKEGFDRQFELFRRLVDVGLDLYAYVTFTVANTRCLKGIVADFLDRLQAVHPLLPLRTVPLEVFTFGPVRARLTADRRAALENQYSVVDAWREELDTRFSQDLRDTTICDVPLRRE